MGRMTVSKRFEGKVVLVSGAASGIGLATARAFAREGAKVVLVDQNTEGAAEAAVEIARTGGTATSIGANVSDPAACIAMVDHAMKHYGGLHVAVNNAGVGPTPYAEFEDLRIEDWERVIAINLNAVFYAMKAEVPALRKSGGTAIVNTASAAGLVAVPNMASYVASKHGVAGLTRATALDLIRHGIRVNAICPGLTKTPIMRTEGPNLKLQAELEAQTPIRRWATADEMAAAILFLASGEASYMVGSMMVVDGGLTAC
jgi:NAD(P)-dependent dehydrogenase (short-subunit alcohol dehydrogenase family)